MPYIKRENRPELNNITDIFKDTTLTPGNMNYMVTKLCHAYVKKVGENYQTYNDLIGMLECCKMELYRRKISLYEDLKSKENGDV